MAEARRSLWTGNLPIEGRITALMCDHCGRILLYGEPRAPEASLPRPAAPPDPGPEVLPIPGSEQRPGETREG